MRRTLFWILTLTVATAVIGIYVNHFDNGFHFDDYHAVNNNPFVRSLENIPRFFIDARTFSALPDHYMYRPLTTASLAIDYWLGGGLSPFYFHLSTFIWFLAQLILMYFMYLAVLDMAHPHPLNRFIALAGVAWYGLHPACAETVNYVIQRADLYSTLGVIASFVLYQYSAIARRNFLYLLPVVLGALAKPPAIMFAPLFLVYLVLFESETSVRSAIRRPRMFLPVVRRSFPAWIVCGALYLLQDILTPKTFNPGGESLYRYVFTQPFAAFHYFKSLFFPTDLSADTDWQTVRSILSDETLLGLFFVMALLALAWRSAEARATRPITFGILWFFIAMAPTSFVPLAEVINDHRMFFPFVGLVLAVLSAISQYCIFPLSVHGRRRFRLAVPFALLAALPLYAYGVVKRNQVWHSEESLWYDVTIKSPRNGRGLMNYGLTQMNKGEYQTALNYFERAQHFTPNYYVLEINLGIVKGAVGRAAEAEAHFRRAISLAPLQSEPHFYYGRWLRQQQRLAEAETTLIAGIRRNPLDFECRHLLMQVLSEEGKGAELKALAEDTLRHMPDDPEAKSFLPAPR